jgi:hypothetical protein
MKTLLKHTALTAILLILAAGLASCRDKEKPFFEKPFLEVDETPLYVSAGGGLLTIKVNSSDKWTAVVEYAENPGGWGILTFMWTPEYEGVYVNISTNFSRTARSATVYITSGNLERSVTINQKSFYTVSQDSAGADVHIRAQCYCITCCRHRRSRHRKFQPNFVVRKIIRIFAKKS